MGKSRLSGGSSYFAADCLVQPGVKAERKKSNAKTSQVKLQVKERRDSDRHEAWEDGVAIASVGDSICHINR
jgi:hypothetical protein